MELKDKKSYRVLELTKDKYKVLKLLRDRIMIINSTNNNNLNDLNLISTVMKEFKDVEIAVDAKPDVELLRKMQHRIFIPICFKQNEENISLTVKHVVEGVYSIIKEKKVDISTDNFVIYYLDNYEKNNIMISEEHSHGLNEINSFLLKYTTLFKKNNAFKRYNNLVNKIFKETIRIKNNSIIFRNEKVIMQDIIINSTLYKNATEKAFNIILETIKREQTEMLAVKEISYKVSMSHCSHFKTDYILEQDNFLYCTFQGLKDRINSASRRIKTKNISDTISNDSLKDAKTIINNSIHNQNI